MSDDQRSLHRRILDDIGSKIVSGQWPPGTRIPFEHQLTAQYGCSRMTVNKALAELARSGLIERRRRSGSFVSRPRSQAAILEIHDIRAEVEALGLSYGYACLSRSRRKAGKSEELDVDAGTPLLELTCRHRAGQAPFCVEHRLIALDAVPEAADEPFDTTAPGPWLLSHVPWSEAEHTIRAEAATPDQARLLDIDKSAACLVIERRTWSAGKPVTFVRLVYPGSSHALVARFAPADR